MTSRRWTALIFVAVLTACGGGSVGSSLPGAISNGAPLGGAPPPASTLPPASPPGVIAPGGAAPPVASSAPSGAPATGAPATGAPATVAPGTPAPSSPGTAPPTATPNPNANAVALAPTGTGSYADPNGSFGYAYYVSSRAKPGMPLVLALHGCLQNPTNFEAGTRWFEDAEANGYAVVMPAHVASALNPKGCWQFWSDHYRGKGEPEVLVGLVRQVAAHIGADPTRIYVAGLSSGAAMAVALGADYPDVFAAIGSGSGTEYQPCVTDDIGTCYLALTTQTFDQDPTASGKAAYAQMPSNARAVPAILFQGDADTVVAPFNLPQALTSLAVMNDGFTSGGRFPGAYTTTATTHDVGTVPGGHAYDHYTADGGRLDWTIVHGMNHAWSGGVNAPASNASDGNNYDDPGGPNATVAMRTFFFGRTLTSAVRRR